MVFFFYFSENNYFSDRVWSRSFDVKRFHFASQFLGTEIKFTLFYRFRFFSNNVFYHKKSKLTNFVRLSFYRYTDRHFSFI